MKAAVSLLRNQLVGKHAETVQLQRYCELLLPKCRFMQYKRANENQKQLGMVSEDGTKMIALSHRTCASSDMIQFIQQRYCMSSLQKSIRFMDVQEVDETVQLLPPLEAPHKIIGVECNYKDSADEQNLSWPKEPSFFVKFSTSIIGALDNIRAHNKAKRIDYGCQLGVVIGRKARNVPLSAAMSCVFGYMLAQDITARDWQDFSGGQSLLSKSLDTFCPLGPVIVHKNHIPDVNNLWIKTFINNQEQQNGNTCNMIFKIDYIIHRLSQFITLSPGDIILTGTPAGTGAFHNPTTFLKPGDIIESEIQNLGKLQNKVVNPFS